MGKLEEALHELSNARLANLCAHGSEPSELERALADAAMAELNRRGVDFVVYEYQDARDAWNDYNHRQEFEHDLINRTTTWLLTTQALLFAGYGITFGSRRSEGLESFRDVVAVAGLVIAALMLVAVGCVINSKRISWHDYRRYFERSNPPNDLPGPLKGETLPWGVRTLNTQISVLPDLLLPLVFMLAWCVLLL